MRIAVAFVGKNEAFQVSNVSEEMEFVAILKSVRKKLSTYPRKLPDLQIKQGIKLCHSISEANRLLRYSCYEEEDLEELQPSLTLANVLLQRLVIILVNLNGKTTKDWCQINCSLFYIKKTLSQHFCLLLNVHKWQFLTVQIIVASRMLHMILPPQKEVFASLQERVAKDSTDVRYNEDRGRHFVAKRDTRAGEILLIDSNPILKIIFDPQEDDYDTFCINCGDATICPLPCPKCPDVLFCSLPCLRIALGTFHYYECSMRLYGFLRCLSKPSSEKEMSVGRMLPLRLLTNYKGEFPICRVRDPTESLKFESPYEQFMSLSSHHLQDDEGDESWFVSRALIDWLMEESSFNSVHSVDELCRDMSVWLGIVEANSFALEVPNSKREKRSLLRAVIAKRQIGTAVFGAASYFNHSCDPNVTFFTVGSGKAIMVATQSVRAGQELCISYGPTFPYQTTAQRQNYVSHASFCTIPALITTS